MATDFPNSPSNGDTHAGFTYNSTTGAWESSASASVSYANVAAFPSSPTEGDIAYAQDTNALYVYDGSEWDRISSGSDESPRVTTEPPTTTQDLNDDGTTSTVTMVAEDPEGFDIEYGIRYNTSGNTLPSQLASATTINQSTGVYTFTPTTNTSNEGSFTARLTASDGNRVTTRNKLQFVPDANYTFCVNSLGGSVYGNIFKVNGSNTTFSRGGNPPISTTTLSLDTSRTIQYLEIAAGNSVYANLGSIDLTSGTSDDFTMEFFMYTANSTNYAQVINETQVSNSKTFKYANTGGWYWYSGGSYGGGVLTNTGSQWYHIIVQGDKATNTLHYWKDGTYLNSVSVGAAWWTNFSSWSSFYLNGTGTESYATNIGELKIYQGYQKYTPNSSAAWDKIFSQ